MGNPTVSVNICVYQPGHLLQQALNCMLSQDTGGHFSFEILIIDDEPSPATESVVTDIARSAPVPVRYIASQGKGISHARNVGIEHSGGTYVAWFDQDQTTERTWLAELLRTALTTGADWVDGPRDLLLNEAELSTLNGYMRACLGELSEGEQPHQVVRRYASCTGNALVTKIALDAAGPFDETILDGWEDWDYVRRFREQGFTCWHAPRAVVHHVVPPERLKPEFFEWHAARVGSGAGQAVLGLQVHQHQAAPAIGHRLQLSDLEGEDTAQRGGAGHVRGRRHQH